MDQLCDEGQSNEIWTERLALRETIDRLTDREKKILQLRYYVGKTQREISAEVGISQTKVSRLEKNALGSIRIKDLPHRGKSFYIVALAGHICQPLAKSDEVWYNNDNFTIERGA